MEGRQWIFNEQEHFSLFFQAHALITKQYSQSSLSICGGGEPLYAAASEYSLQHMFINDFLL